MRYLLDTNMVTYYLEGLPKVVERLEETRPRDRYLSFITVGEIYHGIYFSSRVQKNLSHYRAFFKKVLPSRFPDANLRLRSNDDQERSGVRVRGTEIRRLGNCSP